MLPKAVGQNLGKGFLGRGRGQGEVGGGRGRGFLASDSQSGTSFFKKLHNLTNQKLPKLCPTFLKTRN